MAMQLKIREQETLSDDVLDLFLDEADRALLEVEARTDEPGRRFSLTDLEGSEIEDLRLALAELSDAYPGMHYELESIADRLRKVGARAAFTDLEQRPHIIDFVRMSLEVFFRQFPTLEHYEAQGHEFDDEEDGPAALEVYEVYRQLVVVLRSRIS